MRKIYRLTAADGTVYESDCPGKLGGYTRGNKKYGTLECKSANDALPNYAKSRVFFADEATAIAAGYRPCAKCMPERYAAWNLGGEPGTEAYPWLIIPRWWLDSHLEP